MQISRAELFKRVWESPLRTLAKEFDISDVGLAKACRKHRIPTPPRGHWAKVAIGRPSPPPHLPDSAATTVTLDARRHRASVQPIVPLTPELANIRVGVSKSTDELSPTARRTLNVLSKMKPDADRFLTCGAPNVFSCSISPDSVQRAVGILDAIERSLPGVGGTLISDAERKRVLTQVKGEKIGLSLVEEYKRTETIIKHPKHSYLDKREFQYHFSGRLKLTLDGDYQGRKIWADGIRARLEDKLGSVVAGILGAAVASVALREKREADRRHWEEESRRSAQVAEERRQRLDFTDKLAKESAAWRRYQDAYDYLDHILAQAKASPSPLPESSQAWMAMAGEMVRRMNPAVARVRVLQAGPTTDGWLGLFGEVVVRT